MKRGYVGLWFFVLSLLFIQSQLFAGIGLNVVENNSIGAAYVNLGKIYEVVREQLAAINMLDPNIKEQISQTLSAINKDNSLGKELNIDDLVAFVEKWHKDAYFIPTGGLWVSVSKGLQPKIVIEANSKLDKVAEFLHKAIGSDLKYDSDKKLIKFQLPDSDLFVEITPQHTTIGKVADKPEELNNLWKPFLQRVTSLNQIFALELDMQSVFEAATVHYRARKSQASCKACSANMRVLLGAVEMYNMDHRTMMSELDIAKLLEENYLMQSRACPEGGSYSNRGDLTKNGEIVCSVHNTINDLKESDKLVEPLSLSRAEIIKQLPDPRLQHVVRARIFTSTDSFLIATAFSNEEVRQEVKEMVTQGLAMFEQQIQQTANNEQLQAAKKLMTAIEQVDKAPWLGLSLKSDSSEQTQVMIVTATIGTLAAIAVPNFLKARQQARQKACFANQRVLLGATEMYNMDNYEMLSKLDIEALFKGNYLLSPPVCPDGGIYGSEGDLATGDGKIKCSVHGSFEDY